MLLYSFFIFFSLCLFVSSFLALCIPFSEKYYFSVFLYFPYIFRPHIKTFFYIFRFSFVIIASEIFFPPTFSIILLAIFFCYIFSFLVLHFLIFYFSLSSFYFFSIRLSSFLILWFIIFYLFKTFIFTIKSRYFIVNFLLTFCLFSFFYHRKSLFPLKLIKIN